MSPVLACKTPKQFDGSGQSDVSDPSYDQAWDRSKDDANADAKTQALKKAFDQKCPAACGKKKISLHLAAATDPTCVNNGAGLRPDWECRSQVAWTMTITCVPGKPPAPVPGAAGVPERPRRLDCGDENETFEGKGEGTSSSTVKAVSEETAGAKAEDAAYMALLELLSRLRCPARCPERDGMPGRGARWLERLLQVQRRVRLAGGGELWLTAADSSKHQRNGRAGLTARSVRSFRL